MVEAAPVLATPRLRLRGHRRDDLPHLRTLWQHPETVRFIGGGTPQSDQAVWFRLLRYAGFWPILGYGFWAIEDRETGVYLGDAGLFDAERGLAGLDGRPEAGWALLPHAAGKGLASEAMRAVLGWADAHLDAAGTGCIIDPDNAASIRVAAKLGFEEQDRPTLEGRPVVLFHRRRGQAARTEPEST